MSTLPSRSTPPRRDGDFDLRWWLVAPLLLMAALLLSQLLSPAAEPQPLAASSGPEPSLLYAGEDAGAPLPQPAAPAMAARAAPEETQLATAGHEEDNHAATF